MKSYSTIKHQERRKILPAKAPIIAFSESLRSLLAYN